MFERELVLTRVIWRPRRTDGQERKDTQTDKAFCHRSSSSISWSSTAGAPLRRCLEQATVTTEDLEQILEDRQTEQEADRQKTHRQTSSSTSLAKMYSPGMSEHALVSGFCSPLSVLQLSWDRPDRPTETDRRTEGEDGQTVDPKINAVRRWG